MDISIHTGCKNPSGCKVDSAHTRRHLHLYLRPLSFFAAAHLAYINQTKHKRIVLHGGNLHPSGTLMAVKGRDKVKVLTRLHLGSACFNVPNFLQDSHVCFEPIDHRSCHPDGAFQGVDRWRPGTQLIGDSRDQSPRRRFGYPRARVVQGEGAAAKSGHCLTRPPTVLAD